MAYDWDFSVVLRSNELLWKGLVATLNLTAVTIAIAVPLGFILALALLSNIRMIYWFARAFVDFFRTSALLVLIIWFYFAFPMITGLRVGSFEAAALALGLQNSAYLAEVFRAGITSVARGQWEAGRALGLHLIPLFWLIIAPQAIRPIIPVLVNVLSEIIKGTSLAAAIAYAELAFQGSMVASTTYRPLETYTIVAALYFVVIFLLNQLASYLERRLGRNEVRA
ncbi:MULTISPECIES: amino acid ABC transporter permease [Hyphomicrobiales]|jgi:polar amino acid transport system permease protein|uniref:amino acid ABC transporter permease n=1 Tax=Hyphomicrobiales TaxID=356 RepID=UPI0010F79F40|nr:MULTISPECIES: amino acid ABC transporter permease [Mesorhizobium]MBA3038667.1 amino acid ABC transporter permease [Rhizobiaceae bacterium]MBN8949182.1 amino acid ABC transporter permease [Rhizobium tropici]MBN8993633.1 amino acid ABC transporter permease [Hyphomicrobiales bacterium]MBN9217124.1 amino acid ABC transporter permease [Mesorhizobium sp.]MBN9272403.1 amino acid ABC transporter permease [Mesorhizobium sp.]